MRALIGAAFAAVVGLAAWLAVWLTGLDQTFIVGDGELLMGPARWDVVAAVVMAVGIGGACWAVGYLAGDSSGN